VSLKGLGMKRLIIALILTAAGCSHVTQRDNAAADRTDLTLWYAQPAAKWEEALPVGSGRLGAMVFITVETSYTNHYNQLCALQRSTVIRY